MEVAGFVPIEDEGGRQGITYGSGRVALAALFEANIVFVADARAGGHLLAPKSGHAADTPGMDTDQFGGEALAVAPQELRKWADTGC
jgi:hypothetical protein